LWLELSAGRPFGAAALGGEQDGPFPLAHGRGDGAMHPGTRDLRDGSGAGPGGRPVQDIYIPDLRLGSGIKVPTRDFR
jgi:error-prone DNA polymerase